MISGILNIYKEKGYTSHDVVAKLRGIVGQKKIGHTGTLDPDAEGVLPVCLGRATKVCGLLTDKDKTYETVLLLGRTTDTQDVTGQILSERPLISDGREITPETAKACVMSFEGEYDQVPPMYSALSWRSACRTSAWKWNVPKEPISAPSAMTSGRSSVAADVWNLSCEPGSAVLPWRTAGSLAKWKNGSAQGGFMRSWSRLTGYLTGCGKSVPVNRTTGSCITEAP